MTSGDIGPILESEGFTPCKEAVVGARAGRSLAGAFGAGSGRSKPCIKPQSTAEAPWEDGRSFTGQPVDAGVPIGFDQPRVHQPGQKALGVFVRYAQRVTK